MLRQRTAGLGTLLLVLGAAAPAAASVPKCPNVLIVLDRSCSMADEPDGTQATLCNSACNGGCGSGNTCYSAYCVCSSSSSKISVAHQVLHDVLLGGGGTAAPDSRLRFGFSYFPHDETGGCTPAPGSPLVVPCDYSTNQTISDDVNNLIPNGGTPTAESLNAVAQSTEMQDASRARYVVLVTDGQPGCNGNDPAGPSVNAVSALHSLGVKTLVVGFGSAVVGSTTLDQMAAVGQNRYPDGGVPKAFSATNPAQLSAALTSAIGQAVGELGGSGCDDSCASQGCSDPNDRCDTGQTPPVCVPDVCKNMQCDPGQFCRDEAGSAVCIPACEPGCTGGQVCVDGACYDDHCAQGTCQSCPSGQAPDKDGQCQPNKCPIISCPSDAPFCLYNTCHASPPSATTGTSGTGGGSSGSTGSSGTTGRKANGNVSSAGGCGCGVAGPEGAALLLLGLGALGRLRRRR